MKTIHDFNGYEQIKFYGGRSGAKFGVAIDGQTWLLKFPKSTKDMKAVDLSYTTSPLSEHLGSEIYRILGIPVHQTALGIRDGKLVVACKDFLHRGDTLTEFYQIKNAHSVDIGGTSTSGEGVDLQEVLDTINGNKILSSVEGSLQRFWEMFVVDALIGNNDRNNGNWGLIFRYDGAIELAPVYDNGNAFYNKRSPAKMLARLSNRAEFEQDAFGTVLSVYTYKELVNGVEKTHHYRPFKFIAETDDRQCLAAMSRIAAAYDREKIDAVIDGMPEEYHGHLVMPDEMKASYRALIHARSQRLAELLG
jgi:hypothetical protein